MTRLSSSFVRDRELLLVEAEVVGPTGRTAEAQLVLDTGAAATTLTPRVIEKIGYARRGAFQRAKVHTAIGEEHGYWLRVVVARCHREGGSEHRIGLADVEMPARTPAARHTAAHRARVGIVPDAGTPPTTRGAAAITSQA